MLHFGRICVCAHNHVFDMYAFSFVKVQMNVSQMYLSRNGYTGMYSVLKDMRIQFSGAFQFKQECLVLGQSRLTQRQRS